ncbi:MAG TPA: hypothetical protein VMT99_03255, partial [Candidatus Paceibacterota bacterium]|nr:hypothetical protein [Candidatus Paceibacterota bacterium]
MDSFQHEEERVQKGVFEAIESGKIRMRSRWYFALQTMLSVIGGVILGLFLIYIVGFIIFLLRQSGAWFAPGIGLFGWYIFFRSVPWLLVILSLVFLLVLVILINHFSFSYQRPLFYSLIAILVVVAGASIFIANSYDYQQSGPPILGGYYSSYSAGDLSDVHRGEVQILASNGFVL